MSVDEIRHFHSAFTQLTDHGHKEIFPAAWLNRERARILATMHAHAIRPCGQTQNRSGQLCFDAARNRVDDQRVRAERQMKGVLLGVAGRDERNLIWTNLIALIR